MKRIKAAAMMACTVTALALTACSGQETAEDPAPSVQDDSSADQVQGDAAGTDSAADAAIAEGLTVNNEEDIAPWLDSLGY